jgi:hypothetical protein
MFVAGDLGSQWQNPVLQGMEEAGERPCHSLDIRNKGSALLFWGASYGTGLRQAHYTHNLMCSSPNPTEVGEPLPLDSRESKAHRGCIVG